MRARPLPSTGSTSYLPASTYQVAIMRDQAVAVLGGEVVVLGGVLGDVVELPAVASSSASVSAEIGSPNPLPASANDGPGHGQTARQPSW